MHDAARVRFGERLGALQHVVDRERRGHAPFSLENAREVAPLEVLHDHVGRAVVEGPYVEDTDAMLAANLDRRASLAQKPLDDLGVIAHRPVQALDGHALVELKMRRRDDGAHSSRAEDPLDPILPQEDRARSPERSEVDVCH